MARKTSDPGARRWLLLIHRVPARPDYLRVKVRRRLAQLGAVPLKNTAYVLPESPAAAAGLSDLARAILRDGGDAVVAEVTLLAGLTDGAVEDLLRSASDAEYGAIAAEAKRLATTLAKSRPVTDPARRKAAQSLDRLRTRLERAMARDGCGAGGRERAVRLISLADDLVQGVADAVAGSAPEKPPHGATWVTRTGVMVDRIASAWLIRRFIDRNARFRFVSPRGHRGAPGELRFDMAGAEFTHADGLCTFEVLVHRFGLRDSALTPIAEIVHDLDLEDGRYGRPEGAGLDRMILGLAIGRQPDDVRIHQGATWFDSLYDSFRRRTRPADGLPARERKGART